jgi:fructose-1,6-bisphosphatase/sedoheptulose 1,7-bisphosphatase-like protein
LESAWFQPLRLSSEKLVSKFASFEFSLLYRYDEVFFAATGVSDGSLLKGVRFTENGAVGLCTLNQVDP